MGIDIVHRPRHGSQRLLHAADSAFARGGHHVVAVGRGAVAYQLGVDFCAPCQGVVQLLQHQHATTAGDDEAIAVGIVGPGRALGGIVVLGRQGAHGIE